MGSSELPQLGSGNVEVDEVDAVDGVHLVH
jgi:hypothetical protein